MVWKKIECENASWLKVGDKLAVCGVTYDVVGASVSTKCLSCAFECPSWYPNPLISTWLQSGATVERRVEPEPVVELRLGRREAEALFAILAHGVVGNRSGPRTVSKKIIKILKSAFSKAFSRSDLLGSTHQEVGKVCMADQWPDDLQDASGDCL
jgi:hypothetical protein